MNKKGNYTNNEVSKIRKGTFENKKFNILTNK